MLRILTFITLFSLTAAVSANSLYQVDLILFTHHASSAPIPEGSPLVSSRTPNTIPLQTATGESMTPYHLIPFASSHLRNEYWALNHRPNYQVLEHYTWLQPSNNQRSVALPETHKHGWQIAGTLRVRQSNYYLLDTDLLFSSPGAKSAFSFVQKQRLKPGKTYYLDHPQVGMLIKVQQVA